MSERLKVKWHGLVDCRTEPMSEKNTEAFLSLTLMEQGGVPEGMEQEFEEKSLAYKIMNQRLKVVGHSDQEISFPVKCFISLICDNPGKAVMWAYTLHYMRVAENTKVDMHMLAHWFPMGFPTPNALNEAWDAQKLAIIDPEAFKERSHVMPSPDNWVDYAENWPKMVPSSTDQDAAARNFV